MAAHKVVKHDEWLKARKKHLAKEKEFTRLRDQLSRERRNLPWELVEKPYTFQGEHGTQTLDDLFEGRSQLVIYHAMFHPDTAGPHTPWTEDAPCYVCSFWMDNFNGITIHLNHRDITMAAVSRAPYAKLAAYKKRMGWGFPWLSSLGSDFNLDYRVSFTEEELKAEKVDYNYRLNPWAITEGPGISVFMKDGGQIYHTYSTYARGLDMLNVAYHYMDLVPKGRDEGDGGAAVWVRRRDVGGHGPPCARHGGNGHGPRPDRGLRRDLARHDGGDDVALRDPGGPRVRADGRKATGMAGGDGSACPHVPRRVAAVRRGVLRGLHRREHALAQPGAGGWTGSGSGRRLLRQPAQTGEPDPLP